MTLNNIIVAFNGGEASISALRCALSIGVETGAHVTGLLAHGASSVSSSIPIWMPKDLQGAIIGSLEQRADTIRRIFNEATAEILSADKLHWLEVAGDPDRTVAHYARMFDLIILGQYENLMSADELELHPTKIASQSGKPVLVVPKIWRKETVFGHAVIAWDGRRAITSGISDGLDFLRRATRVSLLTIDTPYFRKPLKGIDLETSLGRQGVKIEAFHNPHSSWSIAQDIVDFAEQNAANILLAGLSSQGLIKTQIMGNTTEGILKRSSIPVFLSH